MTKTMQDVYIVKAFRTPVCKAYKGGLANVRPDDLLAHCLAALMIDAKFPTTEIDDVIIGCAMPEGEQGMNVARIATLLAGYANSVPAFTINRFCSSGLQSIALAADRIASGAADIIIAGGTESMSMVPLGGHNYQANPSIFNDENVGIAYGMGITAEIVADKWNISRTMQDEFALRSHQNAINAIKNNLFNDEIVPYRVSSRMVNNEQLVTKEYTVAVDDGPRSDTSLDVLAGLKSVFKLNGTITAGNSSQMSDGAAALLIVSEKIVKKYNLVPMARFCGFSVTGLEPSIMGVGPITAIPKCLKQCNLKLDDLDWIELNEAFAAQSLAVINELQLNLDKVNPQGGAIALGHPLGATGAIRACTLLHALKRNNLKYGMVTMCIGTGMGAAGIFEKL
jgi:acetyl-CoA acyltransferase